MPLKPSRGAGYQRLPADALWGSAPRYSRRQTGRGQLVSHDDLMPSVINGHRLVPTRAVTYSERRYAGGTFELDGRLVAWLDEGPPPRAVRERARNYLHPTRWYESPYLTQRLEANLGRDGIRAVMHWYALRAEFDAWYADVWDGLDQAEVDARRAALDRAVAHHASLCCGGGHDVRWLERLADKIQAYVWKTYYPSARQHKPSRQIA